MAMQPGMVTVKVGGRNRQQPERLFATFGLDAPTRAGDWGIESVNGMEWLVRALALDETRKRGRSSQSEEGVYFQRMMPVDALRIRGRHNAANALAALALATSTGAALGAMLHGLREYRGEPHRVEPVGILDGVEYFDDSKGTNVGATLAAINGLGAERRLVVILGGDGKGQDFAPLAPVLGTVLFTLPFAFTQELDAGAVDQQIQCRCAGSVRQLNAQVFLAPAHGAEVWHPPVQARQAQQTFDQPQALTQGQSEQAFDAQAELDCRIGEGALTTTFAADSGVPLHVLVQPNCQ
jgi:hypothetical protein